MPIIWFVTILDSYLAACAGDNPPMGCTAEPRTKQDVVTLIQTEVIKPRILKSWYLYPSIFERGAIALEASQDVSKCRTQV